MNEPAGSLAHLAGAVPPAPAWFDRAMAVVPERRFVEVDGAKIETLARGERGRPGLLFLHGMVVSQELGLFDGPTRPVIVSHPAGSRASPWASHLHGERFTATVVVDSLVVPYEHQSTYKGHRVDPTLADALALSPRRLEVSEHSC